MKRKCLAILLTLCMMGQLLPTMPALAAPPTTWTEIVTQKPDGYTESDDCITITSAEGLAWLAKQANNGTDFQAKTITLGAALDMSAYEWVPIGTDDQPFSGTFDGAGKTISGLHRTLSTSDPSGNAHLYVGLFGAAKNLSEKNLNLHAMTASGTVIGPAEPSTLTDHLTTLSIGGVVAHQVNNPQSTIEVSHCTVDLNVDIETTDGVYTAIGGILGATADAQTATFTASDCTVNLKSTTSAPNGFFYTLTGGALGEANDNNSVVIGNSHFDVTTNARCAQRGPAETIATGGVIGKSDRISDGESPNAIRLEGVTCKGSHDFSDTNGILPSVPNAIARIGGFFGDVQGIVLKNSFANTALTVKDSEEVGRFGNVAGYIQNTDLISAENVYTYGVLHQGKSTFINERATHDITNALFAEKCPTVYYIDPQCLTEGLADVPFVYKIFKDETRQADDAFTYSDGDSNDAFSVSQADGGKKVCITPAGNTVPIRADGESVDFTLPISVNPAGAQTYNITSVRKRDNSATWAPPGNTTITPASKNVNAGTEVTILEKPGAWAVRSVHVTLDSDPSQESPLTKTTEGTTGKQRYTFIMPAGDVTVTSVIGMKKASIALTPNALDFGMAYEGYTPPKAQAVTFTNDGDLDIPIDVQPLHSYTITRGKDEWSGEGLQGTLKPGESFVLHVQPNANLDAIALKQTFYSYPERLRITTLNDINKQKYQPQCTFTVLPKPMYVLAGTPTALDFGNLYEGQTLEKSLTLTNESTQNMVVTLPISDAFTITYADSLDGKTIHLMAGASATVHLSPKTSLPAGTIDTTLHFSGGKDANDQASSLDVPATVTIMAHNAITFTPTKTVGYTGGEGYDGVLLEDGTVASDHGFVEPGFLITLPNSLESLVKTTVDPPDGQDDLSDSVTLFYKSNDADVERTIHIEPYGTKDHTTTEADPAKGRYVYRVRMYDNAEKASPLRLTIIDNNHNTVDSDAFTPTSQQPTRRFNTIIPLNGTLTAAITLKNGETITVPVRTEPNNVYTRGLTEQAIFVPLLPSVDTPSTVGTYAQVQANTIFFIGNSNVAVSDPSGIALLVDTTLDNNGLEKYITNNIQDKVTVNDNTAFDKKYLDLVDTKNGNAVIASSTPAKLYWPVPDDFDKDHAYHMVHFNLITRNYTDLHAQLQANPPQVIEETTLETINGKHYLTFDARSGGPYVLVYEKAAPSQPPTPPVEPEPEIADPDRTGVSDWLDTLHHTAYLHGTAKAQFAPTAAMTRAEVAAMFSNLLLDKTVPTTTQFADVPQDAWFHDAVNTMATLGIIKGVGNDAFAPNRPITRAEFTCIAMRFAKLDTSGENRFSDVQQGDWFYDQVIGAIKYGWINGFTDGTFRPNATISRAEVTGITNRLLGRSADQNYIDGNTTLLVHFDDVTPDHWAYYEIVEATTSHAHTNTDQGEKWAPIGE